MKKLMILFVVLISLVAFPQKAEYRMDFGTIANGVTETGYFDFGVFAQQQGITFIDSIVVGLWLKGEADADSVVCYAGFVGSGGSTAYARTYLSTAITRQAGLDIAPAAYGYGLATAANASITSTDIRGCNSLKVVLYPQVAGNDAADPNRAVVVFTIYGT